MTCGLESGIELHFEESGTTVEPESVDIRSDREQYAFGSFESGEIQGLIVDSRYRAFEPVSVYFGGELAYRFFIPEGGLTFKNDLRNDKKTEFELPDAARVLERGSISQSWDLVNLGTMVEDIIDARKDPHNVITDVKFTDGFDPNSEFALEADDRLGFGSISQDIIEFITNEPAITADVGNLTLDGESPAEALGMLAKKHGFDWWADRHGTLYIGQLGNRGKSVTTRLGGNGIRLKEYNIAQKSHRVGGVEIAGQYESYTVKEERSLPQEGASSTVLNTKRLRPMASAEVPEVDGESLKLEATDITSLSQLERDAIYQLLKRMMEDSSGNIVVNGMASEDVAGIAGLEVGDYILVDESVRRCAGDVEVGPFLINGIQHRASPRRGWQITLECSRIPKEGSIETQSFYYDPTDEKAYDESLIVDRNG